MTPRAYYNENDRFCAEWLYNLMQQNLIAPGDIDTRDIRDVIPTDLRGYTQCHFFAGIGIWSSALRSANCPDHRPLWTGSCPCQPFSGAGQGGGFADERHLWPAFFHLIEQCRPATILGEQVASKDALAWLDLVFDDLEGAGYATGAADICAAGAGVDFGETVEGQATLDWIERALVGCPDDALADQLRDLARCLGADDVSYGPAHIRQRLYWMADAQHAERRTKPETDRNAYRRHGLGRGGALGPVADADGGFASDRDLQRSGQQRLQPQDGRAGARRGACDGMADADEGQRGRIADREGCEPHGPQAGWQQGNGIAQSSGDARTLGHAEQPGLQEQRGLAGVSCGASGAEPRQTVERASAPIVGCGDAGAVGHADSGRRIKTGRNASGDGATPCRRQTSGRGGASATLHGSTWIVCTDGKARPTQPGILPLAHAWQGSSRVAVLRAAGNAINKACAARFIEAALNL